MSNSSQSQSRIASSRLSMHTERELFPPDPLAIAANLTPGSLNDESVVRALITQVVRTCGKSRPQIADEMSVLVGDKVTVRMLNSYTSEAAEQHRWPQQYTRAFCHVTGDDQLIRCITERAGFHLMSQQERKFYELGVQIVKQKRAAAEIARLEHELAEVTL